MRKPSFCRPAPPISVTAHGKPSKATDCYDKGKTGKKLLADVSGFDRQTWPFFGAALQSFRENIVPSGQDSLTLESFLT